MELQACYTVKFSAQKVFSTHSELISNWRLQLSSESLAASSLPPISLEENKVATIHVGETEETEDKVEDEGMVAHARQ